MGLTIKHRAAKAKTSKKTSTIAVEDAATEAVAALVDELGKLIEKSKPIADRIDEIKKELVVRAKAKGKDKYMFEGEHFKAEVGAPRNKRIITDLNKVQALLEAVKDGLFMELASVKVDALDDYLTPEERAQCLQEQETDTRVVKTERKK